MNIYYFVEGPLHVYTLHIFSIYVTHKCCGCVVAAKLNKLHLFHLSSFIVVHLSSFITDQDTRMYVYVYVCMYSSKIQ